MNFTQHQKAFELSGKYLLGNSIVHLKGLLNSRLSLLLTGFVFVVPVFSLNSQEDHDRLEQHFVNKVTYVANSPVALIKPTGKCSEAIQIHDFLSGEALFFKEGHMRISIVSVKGVFLSGPRQKMPTSVLSAVSGAHLNSPTSGASVCIDRPTPFSFPCINVWKSFPLCSMHAQKS